MNIRTVRKSKGIITVKKPHEIITARFKLSAREQDLITLAMMEVKKDAEKTKVVNGEFNKNEPEKTDLLQLEYSLPEAKVAELFGVTVKALRKPVDNGIPMLLSVCALLRSRTFVVSDDTGHGFVGGLVESCDYKDGKLTIKVTQEQAERMLDYGVKNNQFGIIDAKLLLSFNSAYTKRILEIISRFKNRKEFKCTVGELCEMTGTTLEAHNNRADRFKSVVLDKPIQQIVSESNGVWTPKDGHSKGYHIDTVRGRKMTEDNVITFKMKYSEPESEPLSADDYDNMTMAELEEIFVAFVNSNTTTPIAKEVFIAFSGKSMAHVSSFGDMTKALEWMTKANELKDEAAKRYIEITGETPY